MFLRCIPAAFVAVFFFQNAFGQTPTAPTTPPSPALKWFEKMTISGYAQFRYNRLFENNPDLKCDACDKGIGRGQTLEFRRARLLFKGNPSARFTFYLQFDFSADASATNKLFMQVRDAYFDFALNKSKELRWRFGQSKVPFGFENLQSSSQRLAFDRNDALNSGVPGERELGTSLLYTPEAMHELFKKLVDDGLKGSGDYGLASIGVYNGQGANKPELNDQVHAIARVSYPFSIGGGQIMEAGVSAYTGKFLLPKDQLSTGVKTTRDLSYDDQRVAGHLVLYPQPIGFQAEYNTGKGPQYNPATDSIETRDLKGGYVMVNYRQKIGPQILIPFVRYQWYDGGRKSDLDARSHSVRETDIGIEYQPYKYLELTLEYVTSHRITQDLKAENNDQTGHFLRVQAQANF